MIVFARWSILRWRVRCKATHHPPCAIFAEPAVSLSKGGYGAAPGAPVLTRRFPCKNARSKKASVSAVFWGFIPQKNQASMFTRHIHPQALYVTTSRCPPDSIATTAPDTPTSSRPAVSGDFPFSARPAIAIFSCRFSSIVLTATLLLSHFSRCLPGSCFPPFSPHILGAFARPWPENSGGGQHSTLRP